MTKVTCDMAMSVDGFVAGPDQTAAKPFGDGVGERLHTAMRRWMFDEREAHADELAAITAAGAFVMGRNMFGPGRGTWDPDWRGWWGAEPPYHAPVFVLTHHAREPVPMEGGTTFHFVTDGIEAALEQARAAAGDRDVAIAGGAAVVNQFVAAGLIDELRLHVVPLLMGAGERLLTGAPDMDLEPIGEPRGTARVTHLRYRVVR